MQKHHTIDSEDLPTNASENEHFQVVVDRAYSRRGFLKSGIGLSAALFLAGPLAVYADSNDTSSDEQPSSLLGFKAIPISTDDTIKIAAGYTASVFAPWGTPLFADAPAWKADGSDDAAAQARQVGDNHDGIHFFPINDSSTEGLLVMNHEYTTAEKGDYIWLFGAGGSKPWTAEKTA